MATERVFEGHVCFVENGEGVTALFFPGDDGVLPDAGALATALSRELVAEYSGPRKIEMFRLNETDPVGMMIHAANEPLLRVHAGFVWSGLTGQVEVLLATQGLLPDSIFDSSSSE